MGPENRLPYLVLQLAFLIWQCHLLTGAESGGHGMRKLAIARWPGQQLALPRHYAAVIDRIKGIKSWAEPSEFTRCSDPAVWASVQ